MSGSVSPLHVSQGWSGVYLRGPEQFSQQGWTALGVEEVSPKDAGQESPTHHLALWSCTENP